jgi:peptidoglycan hydrolase-like protein with peptidoglycan-binding domain
MLRIAVKRVTQGAQGPDVAQVHRALASLGRTVASAERAARVYGPSTAEAVRGVQEELGVPVTGVVDQSTVRVVNARLGSRNADERIVRGSVRLSTGAPATGGLFARVWFKDHEQERVLGEKAVDQDGLFEVRYTLGADVQQRTRIDLRVEIVQPTANVAIATQPDGRAVLQNADLLEVINFVVVQPERQPPSEYDQIAGDVTTILGEPVRLSRMQGEQLQLLADEASYPVGNIAALSAARRLAQNTQLPESMFYALVRSGLPVTLPGLLAANPATLKAALDQAIADKQVREHAEDGRPLVEALKDLPRAALALASVPPRPGTSSVRDLAKLVLTDAEADELLTKYVAAGGNLEAFWSGIATHPKAKRFRLAVDLGNLTNNHLPLVQAIHSRQIQDVAALAALPIAAWDQLLAQTGAPPDTPGATDAERAASYRQSVLGRVEGAFGRPFLAARLRDAGAPAPIVQFLETQSGFDPKRTHLEAFLKGHPAATLGDGDKNELKGYQRVLKLTGNAADAIAIKPHAHSAQQIVAMGRQQLLRKVPALGETRAREIHDRAAQTHAAAIALWTEHAPSLNRTNMAALPRLDPDALRAAAVGDDQEPGPIPDWETLFGSFDLCDCADCNSVHGPAAYFVDLLQFLASRDVLTRLLSRRPDLQEIELSCENTNTVLPYVDLVNEILEDQIARPDPFVAATLAGVTAADFSGPLATDALRPAFTPPLQPGAPIEVLDEGNSWRVVDASFAYQVDRDGTTFKTITRSRQTTGSSDERRAYPQYRNARAYETLKQAFRPWTLPFDRDAAEAATFLQHLGVPRRRLIEALIAPVDPTDATGPVRVRLAAERLGLTDQERRVLVGDVATSRADFWGSAPIEHVQDVLDGAGLRFGDLDRLVSTWFVNRDGSLHIEPPDSCDTEVMTLEGLTDAALSRLHRFVRLWRKIGWTIEELDRVLHAFAIAPDMQALTDDVLVRLADLANLRDVLKCPVLEVLAFWRPIDTDGPDALYQTLFRDEKFPQAVRESFRLRADGADLNDTTQELTAQAAVLQAICRVSGPNLLQLISLTDGALTLSNLSLLLRRARLLQALKLSPDDLVVAQALTGLDPFAAPDVTLRFVRVAAAVRSAGFTWAELDYLLRHRFQPPAIFAPSDERLAAAVTDLRTGLLALDAAAEDSERRGLVMDRLTATLSVPEAFVSALATPAEIATLVASGGIAQADPITRVNAGSQFDLLEKLLKVALVVNRVQLPGLQWQRLLGPAGWLDLATLGTTLTAAPVLPFAMWYRLVQAVTIRRELSVEDGAFDAALSALHAMSIAAPGADRFLGCRHAHRRRQRSQRGRAPRRAGAG